VRREIRGYEPPKSVECPECHSTQVQYSGGKIFCKNCGELITVSRKTNKYGANRTEFNGKSYDSKFEAETAWSLEVRVKAGDIKSYDTQYKVEMEVYRSDGVKAFTVNHKVDFRIHHNDGSFELYEAKGIETADYKMRRKLLENVWLPLHKDHEYTVVKQNKY
jgi:uncharacterized Zn finger protein (UPF0148 family)